MFLKSVRILTSVVRMQERFSSDDSAVKVIFV